MALSTREIVRMIEGPDHINLYEMSDGKFMTSHLQGSSWDWDTLKEAQDYTAKVRRGISEHCERFGCE